MADVGAPSKLTEAQPAILLGLRRGVVLEDAARAGGVSYRTLRNWVLRGEAERERLAENARARARKAEAPYLAFLESYEQALAEGQLVLANAVKKAADGGQVIRETRVVQVVVDGNVVEEKKTSVEREIGPDWRAAAFMLERRFGWARRDRRELFDIDLDDMTNDELQRIANGEDPVAVIATRSAATPSASDPETEEAAAG